MFAKIRKTFSPWTTILNSRPIFPKTQRTLCSRRLRTTQAKPIGLVYLHYCPCITLFSEYSWTFVEHSWTFVETSRPLGFAYWYYMTIFCSIFITNFQYSGSKPKKIVLDYQWFRNSLINTRNSFTFYKKRS